MAPPAIKKAIGALKYKASMMRISRVTTQSPPELEILVLKSTSHDEAEPPSETHARSIALMTHASTRHVTALAAAISRRLRKTRNPTVALKCLVLIHRVAAQGHHTFTDEIRAVDLDDMAAESFEDRDGFVRRFAVYLDERLKETWLETAVDRLARLVRTLGLAAALRPTILAAEKAGQVVVAALSRVVEESFSVCLEVFEAARVLEKRAVKMGPEEVEKALAVCNVAARIIGELAGFYGWCRDIGVALPLKLQERKFQEIEEPDIPVESEGERREEKASLSEGVKLGETIEEKALQSEGDKLALALFSDQPAVEDATWQAFPEDWEVALVESAAALSRHQIMPYSSSTLDEH